MKTYRVSLTFMTAFVLLIVSPFLTARGTASAPVAAKDLSVARGVLVRAHNARTSAGASSNLSPLTLRELARARRATAKYHDIENLPIALLSRPVPISRLSTHSLHNLMHQLLDGELRHNVAASVAEARFPNISCRVSIRIAVPKYSMR